MPYYLSYMEFNILFEIVYNFYKKFIGIYNLAYLVESHEIPNQLTRYYSAIIHFRYSLNGDVLNIKRAKRLNRSPGPRYT